jgi:hypothetical protein
MSGFLGLFGDNSDAYNNYAQGMMNMGNNFNPYIQQGMNATNEANQNYQNFLNAQQGLMSNPNALQDSIAKGFSMSPYQQSLLGTTTQAMNMNAANTGMIQSPVAQQALNSKLNTMTGQFLNDYVNRGMDTYMKGYGSFNDLANMTNFDRTQGFGAMEDKQSLEDQAQGAALQGSISQQQGLNNFMGDVTGGVAGYGSNHGWW